MVRVMKEIGLVTLMAGAVALGATAAQAGGDPTAGAQVFKRCAICHSNTKDGPNKIGPNLWNVLNRPIASHGGFSYSDALKGKSGDKWTYENLNHFLTNPKDFAPGTKMTFAGLPKTEDRANVIAYLNSMGSNLPLPKPAPAPAADAAPAGDASAAPAADSAPADAAPAN